MAPTTPRICVYIDNREDDLWALLEPWRAKEGPAAQQDGWWVESKMLDVGDIAFVLKAQSEDQEDQELLVLERKSAEDLGASQRDGRYREQRARLLAKKGAGVSIGYVLEALMPWSPTLTRTWCRGAFKEVHLQHAIVKLQMHYGIPVIQASSLKETAMWVRRISAALVEDPGVYKSGLATDASNVAAAYTQAIQVKKAANMDGARLLNTLLRTIPGVGAAAAEAIVRHVGDAGFPGFYALSQEDLGALPMGDGPKAKRKIGAALAAKLWSAFHTSAKIASVDAGVDATDAEAV